MPTSIEPAAIKAATRWVACCAEPQETSTVVHPTAGSWPVLSHALRVTLRLCSPAWVTQPPMICSTSPGSTPARAITSSWTRRSSSTAFNPASQPFRLPIGVRAAATTTGVRSANATVSSRPATGWRASGRRERPHLRSATAPGRGARSGSGGGRRRPARKGRVRSRYTAPCCRICRSRQPLASIAPRFPTGWLHRSWPIVGGEPAPAHLSTCPVLTRGRSPRLLVAFRHARCRSWLGYLANMRLSDSEDRARFRERLRAWLRANVPPAPAGAPRRWDAEELRAFGKARYEAGYAGLTWPVACGGRGLPPAYQAIYAEESVLAGAPDHAGVIGLNMVGPTIIRYGTPQQQATFLPRILSGETVFCQGFSEPEAGSDLASVRTRARPHPDGYRIDGEKVWSSYAHLADHCLLLARTDPDVGKHEGLTCFLLDMHAPGVDVRSLRELSGDTDFSQIVLTGVVTSPETVLGPVGAGWRVAMTTLAHERGTFGITLTARLAAQLDRLIQTEVATGWAGWIRTSGWSSSRCWPRRAVGSFIRCRGGPPSAWPCRSTGTRPRGCRVPPRSPTVATPAGPAPTAMPGVWTAG